MKEGEEEEEEEGEEGEEEEVEFISILVFTQITNRFSFLSNKYSDSNRSMAIKTFQCVEHSLTVSNIGPNMVESSEKLHNTYSTGVSKFGLPFGYYWPS